MRTFTFLKHKTHLFSFIVLMLASILYSLPAFSQVDYYYGVNKKGFRLGIGVAGSMLNAHYDKNPTSLVGVGTLDYDFSPYISLGVEYQYGNLKGEDVVLPQQPKQYYNSITNSYNAFNLNLRVSVGAISDYSTSTGLQDAIKRIYLGVGAGQIINDITPGLVSKSKVPIPKPTLKPTETLTVIPVNFGTNINLPGILGPDKLELNPNFQYNYVNGQYLDGLPRSKYSTVKYTSYTLFSLSLKYKF